MRRELINVVNLQDKMMNTALHYATQLWPQEVVRYVLELGANIGVKNVYDEVRAGKYNVHTSYSTIFQVPISHILPDRFVIFIQFSGSDLTYFT